MKFIYLGLLTLSFCASSLDALDFFRKKTQEKKQNLWIDKECASFLGEFITEIDSKDVTIEDYITLVASVISIHNAPLLADIDPKDIMKIIDLNKIKWEILAIYKDKKLDKDQKIDKLSSAIIRKIIIPLDLYLQKELNSYLGIKGKFIDHDRLEKALKHTLMLKVPEINDINVVNNNLLEKALGLKEDSLSVGTAYGMVKSNNLSQFKSSLLTIITIVTVWGLYKAILSNDSSSFVSFPIITITALLSCILYYKTSLNIEAHEQLSKEIYDSALGLVFTIYNIFNTDKKKNNLIEEIQ